MPKNNNKIKINKPKVKSSVKAKSTGNTSTINRSKPNRNIPRKLTDMLYSTDSQDAVKHTVGQLIDRGKNNVLLSQCAAKYASAIANPWSPGAAGACVPYGDSRSSQKTTTFARFDAVVGTNGIGFAIFTPTIVNDFATAWYTSATFTGTTAAVVTTGLNTTSTVGVNFINMANLPYQFSSLAQTQAATAGGQLNRGRIVSYGISASYTGTELNMGGLVYCFSDPAHNNMQGASIAQLGTRMESDVSNVSRDKCWLMASAVDSDELEYPGYGGTPSEALGAYFPFSRNAYLDSASATGNFTNGAAPLIIMFTGVAGNTLHIEIVQHSEFVGPITEGKTTPSVMDAEGTMTVLAAANKVPLMKVANPGVGYGKLFFKALEYTGRELLPVAVGALKAMLV